MQVGNRRAGRACLLALWLGTYVAGAQESARNPLLHSFTAGKAAVEDGMYDLAATQLNLFIDKAPKRHKDLLEARILMGRVLFGQRRYKAMVRSLNSARKSFNRTPQEGSVVFWLAAGEYQLKEFGAALKRLDGFEKQYAASPYVLQVDSLRARCYLGMGENEEAFRVFECFEKSHAKSPQGPINMLAWAKALMAAGKKEKAVELLLCLIILPAENREGQEAKYWYAQALIEDKELAKAEMMLMSLADQEKVRRDIHVEAWFSLARVREQQGRLPEAEKALGEGIKRAHDKRLKEAGDIMRGQLLLKMKKLDEGAKVLKSFISGHLKDPRARFLQLELAGALLDNAKNDKAIAEYQNFLESFSDKPGQAQALFGKAWGIYNLGRHSEAADFFMKAHDMFATPEGKERSLCKVGDSYFAGEQYKKALATYEQFLKVYPESRLGPQVMSQMAESLAYAGDVAAAEHKFLELVEKHPQSQPAEGALLRVAELKGKDGQLGEALAAYNRAMTTYTNGLAMDRALYGRGVTFYRMFLFEQALKDFEMVVNNYSAGEYGEHAYYWCSKCNHMMFDDDKALLLARNFVDRYSESKLAPNVLFWLGEQSYNSSEYKDAEIYFQRVVAEYPKHELADDAVLWAGLSAFYQKEYLRAVEHFTALAQSYKESSHLVVARFSQGDALAELGQYPRAILVFDEIIKNYGDHELIHRVYLRKGDCQFTLGANDRTRHEEAMVCYKKVADDEKADLSLVLEAQYKMGRCLMKMQQPGDAYKQYYMKVVIPYFEAREKGRALDLDAQKWFTRAAFAATDIMISKGKWHEAVKMLKRVIEADVPEKSDAGEKIEQIRDEHWWLF